MLSRRKTDDFVNSKGIKMKKIVALVAVLFSVVSPVQANADIAPSVVVVDYLFDSKSPEFSSKVVAKQCFTADKSPCVEPTFDQVYKNGDSALHGTLMATTVAKVNPNANIILITIAKVSSKGVLQAPATGQFNTIMTDVLKWVAQNKATYNIASVSTSMSLEPNKAGTSCSSSPLTSPVATLTSSNIGVFFSAGNTGNASAVKYPACIPGVLSIGATNASETLKTGVVNPISLASSATGKVDFYALGSWALPQRNISGQTSPATAAIASYWAKNYKGTYSLTYDFLKSKATVASNQNVSTNMFVNVLG